MVYVSVANLKLQIKSMSLLLSIEILSNFQRTCRRQSLSANGANGMVTWGEE